MRNLEEVTDALVAHFDGADAAREKALAASREVIRASGSAVKACHRGGDPASHLEAASEAARRMREAAAGRPELESAGYVESALAELAEARFVLAARDGESLPTPEELEVTPAAYVLGLGDLVGELRRFALDALVEGDADAARERLDQMEDVYAALMRFDYPSALVDVRRKQDTARRLLERTRGEVAVAASGKSLEMKMQKLKDLLDEIEEEGKERPKKAKANEDLDIDAVW